MPHPLGTAASAYLTNQIDQYQAQRMPDTVPADEVAKETSGRALAVDIGLYGRVAAL